jgi:cell division protein FtsA
MDEIVVGIDVGTAKVCTLIGRVEEGYIRILGVGIEPSSGIMKGVVVDQDAASQAIANSIKKAEQTSGLDIKKAIVGLSGSHIASVNSHGAIHIKDGNFIDEDDAAQVIETAATIAISNDREIIQVIPEDFIVDGQANIRIPIGMHGDRLETDIYIITAASDAVNNLRQCMANAGVEISQFVLTPLASAQTVLTTTERELGAIVCDIGAGTTGLVICTEENVRHAAVLPVGGNYITSDIAFALNLPLPLAEEVKLRYGFAQQSEIDPKEHFNLFHPVEGKPVQINRRDLSNVIEARVEEIFGLVLEEFKRSGYEGQLPAGLVLTGGSSSLPGIRNIASNILGIPVRIAAPENLVGLVDRLHSPAYSASIGLLQCTADVVDRRHAFKSSSRSFLDTGIPGLDKVNDYLKRLIGDSSTDAPPPGNKRKKPKER